MIIRRFQKEDAKEVSDLIAITLRTTNVKDYSEEYIENDIRNLQPENILERAAWTHFYVACEGNKIIGCGAIGSYWGKEDEMGYDYKNGIHEPDEKHLIRLEKYR